MNEPWHQQPKESAKQFQLFDCFLNLEPDLQTYQTVSKRFAVSREYVERIAKKFYWIERTRDRTNHFKAIQDEIKAKAAQKIAFNWIDWEVANFEKVRVATEQMLSRCQEMLDAPLTEEIKKQQPVFDKATGAKITDSQGNSVYQNITIIKPIRFTASDVLKYAEAVVILTKYLVERNRITIPIRQILPTRSKPLSEMTGEERESYIERLRELQRKILRGENIIEIEDYGE